MREPSGHLRIRNLSAALRGIVLYIYLPLSCRVEAGRAISASLPAFRESLHFMRTLNQRKSPALNSIDTGS